MARAWAGSGIIIISNMDVVETLTIEAQASEMAISPQDYHRPVEQWWSCFPGQPAFNSGNTAANTGNVCASFTLART